MARKETAKEKKEAKRKCPWCGVQFPIWMDKCPQCGWEVDTK